MIRTGSLNTGMLPINGYLGKDNQLLPIINFSRKIRQQLLIQNKVSKYLLYAIGEIVLVVIEILIALQINNWNEGQKEKQILLSLPEDFKVNLSTLEYSMKIRNPLETLQRLFAY